jgi:hypothetical protein
MNRKLVLCTMAALVLCTSSVRAQDEKTGMTEQQMMEEWAKYATPTDMHKHLEKMVGKWSTVTKMWMDPAAPAMESKGMAEYNMTLGGRWLQMRYTGDMMGQPFEGMGMTGYDIFNKNYVSTWTDNMSTGMMSSKGNANADGTEITMSGTTDEPVTGEKNKKFREVIKITSPDAFTLEMYDTVKGKEVRVMEITHTRM